VYLEYFRRIFTNERNEGSVLSVSIKISQQKTSKGKGIEREVST
jgi:hypothetical protein